MVPIAMRRLLQLMEPIARRRRLIEPIATPRRLMETSARSALTSDGAEYSIASWALTSNRGIRHVQSSTYNAMIEPIARR